MNNAIINFLFNSQGAVNQLNDFKSKFDNAIESMQNSALGKFAAIGTSLAGIFSVRDVVEHTRKIAELHEQYSELLSLRDISLFSNEFELLGGRTEEATGALEKMQSTLTRLRSSPNLPDWFVNARLNIDEGETGITFLEKIRENFQSGLMSEAQVTEALKDMGIYSYAMRRWMGLREDEQKQLRDMAEKMGVVSDESVQRMTEFQYATGELRGSFRKFGDNLLKSKIAFKALELLNSLLDKFINLSEPAQNGILGLIFALTMLPTGLRTIKGIWQLASAFKALGMAMALPLARVALIAFIVAVIFNIGGLRDSLDDCLDSFNKWNAEFSKEHPGWSAFLNQLEELARDVLHPIKSLKEAYDIYDSLVQDFDDSLNQFDKEHPFFEKAFPIKAILDWNAAILQFVLHPLQTIEDIYNRLGKATGWWTPTNDVSKTQQNVVKRGSAEIDKGIESEILNIDVERKEPSFTSDILGIRQKTNGGYEAPKTNNEVGAVKSALTGMYNALSLSEKDADVVFDLSKLGTVETTKIMADSWINQPQAEIVRTKQATNENQTFNINMNASFTGIDESLQSRIRDMLGSMELKIRDEFIGIVQNQGGAYQ